MNLDDYLSSATPPTWPPRFGQVRFRVSVRSRMVSGSVRLEPDAACEYSMMKEPLTKRRGRSRFRVQGSRFRVRENPELET